MFLTSLMQASRTMNTRDNFNIEDVIGYDALYESAMKCCLGTKWKTSVSSFMLNIEEKILKLSKDLHDGTYKAKEPVHFKITSPKPRDISSITFRDRVFQRSLNDNVVYPYMTKSFIYANFACQKGKGTDKARDYLDMCMHKYYRKHGNVGYILQVDIKGYYPNMRHDVCEKVFEDKLPPEVFVMVRDILRMQYKDEKGYDAGSQLIQIAGISVLDKMDHMIKERLHIKYYMRYMDDFLLIHSNYEYLQYCLGKIVDYLKTIGFDINTSKTKIIPLSDGVDWLGYHYRLTDSGKVVRNLLSPNIKRQRKKLYRLVSRWNKGLIPLELVNESYKSWCTHASKGNTQRIINRMNTYYNSLYFKMR